MTGRAQSELAARPSTDALAFVAALTVGAVAVVAAVASHRFNASADLLGATSAASYIVCAAAVRGHAPRRLVFLLLLAGAGRFMGELRYSNVEVIRIVGWTLRDLYDPVLAHLCLSFPTGRLPNRASRVMAAVAYLTSVGLAIVRDIIAPDYGGAHIGPPLHFLYIAGAGDVIRMIQNVVELILVVIIAPMVVARARRARGFARFSLFGGAIAFTAISLVVAAVADSATNDPSTPMSGGVETFASLGVMVAAVGITSGVLSLDRMRARLALIALQNPEPSLFQGELALTLGDPQLRLLVGDARATPATGQVATPLSREGKQLGTLVHQAGIDADPELLELVTALATRALVAHSAPKKPPEPDPDVPEDPGAGTPTEQHSAFEPVLDAHVQALVAQLTTRQRDVLELLSDGHSNNAIANRLGISPKTVEKHVRDVYEALELPAELRANRRVAAALAWRSATGQDGRSDDG